MPRLEAVGLVFVVAMASLSAGVLVSEAVRQIAGVAFTEFTLSLIEGIGNISPTTNPVKVVAGAATIIKSAVTGETTSYTDPFESVLSLENIYVYLGILINNLKVLAAPGLFHLAILAARLVEYSFGGSRVKGEETAMGLALLPLMLNGFLLGGIVADEPLAASIATLEVLALSSTSFIAAEAKLSSGDVVIRIRDSYRRHWQLIPLALAVLMASAAFEAWLIGGVEI